MRIVIAVSLALAAAAAGAQEHAHHGHDAPMTGALGPQPMTREASGTSWQPDASAMDGLHAMRGDWMLMLHGYADLVYDRQGGARGDEKVFVPSMLMAMGQRPAGPGTWGVRAMLSLDPLMGRDGYPLLLQTGETADGVEELVDRQHPHDLFMELTAVYERALAEDLGLQLYAGPVGEPALGPVAFPHRISSFPNPIAPIGHHWLDSTHIAFGVLTGGIYGRAWKAEASLFNGREPDGERFDLDIDALDSYAGRLWLLPSDSWALQVSAGRLNEAEIHEIGEPPVDLVRLTASATYHRPLERNGLWASSIAWGRNREGGEATNALLVETELNLAERDLFFGRFEVVEKTGDDLVLPEEMEALRFTLGKLGVGYVRQLAPVAGLVPGLGVGVTLARVPAGLEPFYGSRSPTGLQLFFRMRPAPMSEMDHPHGRDTAAGFSSPPSIRAPQVPATAG